MEGVGGAATSPERRPGRRAARPPPARRRARPVRAPPGTRRRSTASTSSTTPSATAPWRELPRADRPAGERPRRRVQAPPASGRTTSARSSPERSSWASTSCPASRAARPTSTWSRATCCTACRCGDRRFDFVHQRFLIAGVPVRSFGRLVRELGPRDPARRLGRGGRVRFARVFSGRSGRRRGGCWTSAAGSAGWWASTPPGSSTTPWAGTCGRPGSSASSRTAPSVPGRRLGRQAGRDARHRLQGDVRPAGRGLRGQASCTPANEWRSCARGRWRSAEELHTTWRFTVFWGRRAGLGART